MNLFQDKSERISMPGSGATVATVRTTDRHGSCHGRCHLADDGPYDSNLKQFRLMPAD
ncbi:MAG: hypothetical protein WAO83_05205 [Fuerstiella sp.]